MESIIAKDSAQIKPTTPYYAVIFSSSLTGVDVSGYSKMANRMEDLAKQQEGFLGIESGSRDESKFGITVSYWKDLNSIKNWKVNAEHTVAQRLGKNVWYQCYKLRIVKVEREYDFTASPPPPPPPTAAAITTSIASSTTSIPSTIKKNHDLENGSPSPGTLSPAVTFLDNNIDNSVNYFRPTNSVLANNNNNNNYDNDNGDENPKVTNPSSLESSGLPRLVLRDRPFFQSGNKLFIQHNKQGFKILKLLRHNWFHYFLRFPTKWSLLVLMSFWTIVIVIFAGLYMIYDRADNQVACQLGVSADEPMLFGAAFAFSLETCTTVGYGLPHGGNSFFEEGCHSLQIIIYFQMAFSLLFNAFLITFVYNRLGRSELRGTQVIYSQKALVSIVSGQVRFQIRVFDADAKYPVVEAHIRMYCVMTDRPVPRPLRLLQPDDDLGGVLFLSFPTVASHHIDLYSLLHPPTPSPNSDDTNGTTTFGHNNNNTNNNHDHYSIPNRPSGLVLREADGTTGSRDDFICPICAESYGTRERWIRHVRYQQIVEEKDEYPTVGTHLSLDVDELSRNSQQYPDESVTVSRRTLDNEEELKEKEQALLFQMKEYFQQHVSEVICVVEGIDPIQSGTFQALQSYRTDDIVWDTDGQFAPCLSVVRSSSKKTKAQRIFQVDLDRYHDIVQGALSSKGNQSQQRRDKMKSTRAGDSLFGASPTWIAHTANTANTTNTKPAYRRARSDDSMFRTNPLLPANTTNTTSAKPVNTIIE